MNSLVSRRGFTLIELLVVIAIIGILSSVVLASLNSARLKGRDARRVSDIRQIRTALEMYFDHCGTYPSSLSTSAGSGCPSGNLGTFLPTIPADPSSGEYGYVPTPSGCNGAPTRCTGYTIGAKLDSTNNAAVRGDYDGDVSMTLQSTESNCNELAGNPGDGEVVYCAQP